MRLVNPRDANGGKTNKVTFFNAFTDDEVDSPPVTKFNARTAGYYNQENVNYDSTFHWHHQTNQYHFRAGSTGENKTTFWVKAATNGDTFTNTRADMYVSGRVGIGVSPSAALLLHVKSGNGGEGAMAIENGDPAYSSGLNFFSAGSRGFVGWRGASSTAPFNAYGIYLVNTDDSNLILGTSNAERVRIDASGNVGIGTTAPHHSLDVGGNMTIGSGYTSATTVPANGLVVQGNVGIGTAIVESGLSLQVAGHAKFSGTVTGGDIQAKYQDVAEWVPATVDMAAGTVVVLNPERENEVMPSGSEYDSRVAGVVSAQPGLLLGESGQSKEMIATTGRVKVKVDATRAPIRIGDLLVSSSKSGVAMKSQPIDVGGIPIHRPGTIIGKALEVLESGEGEILVLLSL